MRERVGLNDGNYKEAKVDDAGKRGLFFPIYIYRCGPCYATLAFLG